MAPRKLAAGNWKMNGTLAALAEIDQLLAALPASCTKLAVLDRCQEPGWGGSGRDALVRNGIA